MIKKRKESGRRPPSRKGLHVSEETKRKLRLYFKGRFIGHNNANWKGGTSPLRKIDQSTDRYKIWRKSVFERDGYHCLICGQVGGDLNAHHIKSYKDYPILRYWVDNGITLCVKCHKMEHKKNG